MTTDIDWRKAATDAALAETKDPDRWTPESVAKRALKHLVSALGEPVVAPLADAMRNSGQEHALLGDGLYPAHLDFANPIHWEDSDALIPAIAGSTGSVTYVLRSEEDNRFRVLSISQYKGAVHFAVVTFPNEGWAVVVARSMFKYANSGAEVEWLY